MKKPTKVPLKKIVKRRQNKRRNEYIFVDLECGHYATISAKAYPKRTRCFDCFQMDLEEWEASVSCKHGVIRDGTDPKSCKDCYIEKLESDIECLQKEMQEMRDSLA